MEGAGWGEGGVVWPRGPREPGPRAFRGCLTRQGWGSADAVCLADSSAHVPRLGGREVWKGMEHSNRSGNRSLQQMSDVGFQEGSLMPRKVEGVTSTPPHPVWQWAF